MNCILHFLPFSKILIHFISHSNNEINKLPAENSPQWDEEESGWWQLGGEERRQLCQQQRRKPKAEEEKGQQRQTSKLTTVKLAGPFQNVSWWLASDEHV